MGSRLIPSATRSRRSCSPGACTSPSLPTGWATGTSTSRTGRTGTCSPARRHAGSPRWMPSTPNGASPGRGKHAGPGAWCRGDYLPSVPLLCVIVKLNVNGAGGALCAQARGPFTFTFTITQSHIVSAESSRPSRTPLPASRSRPRRGPAWLSASRSTRFRGPAGAVLSRARVSSVVPPLPPRSLRSVIVPKFHPARYVQARESGTLALSPTVTVLTPSSHRPVRPLTCRRARERDDGTITHGE
jgi:hypothetical protein